MTTKTYPAAFAAFEAANPDIAAWWSDTFFEFALSLRNQVLCGRVLTERQLAAARNCIAKAKAPKPAVSVNVDLIEKAFERGATNGLLRPKMRLLGEDGAVYVISRAPAYGANAGSLYVKRHDDDAYMGKIKDGMFMRVSSCTREDEAAIVAACATPDVSAVAYGRKFGSCSCCGRLLTNALSIELGIGPICRGNFFG